ncbi:MAG: carboxylating nicotinate-nucleotide diphosphorylase [Acidobacteria bacterium]|nr:carboxylating nicotinate-nucleotide diphosphorylase [Acidobacteriota bacterium]
MTLPPSSLIRDIVDRALGEDLPDITSDAIFAPDERGRAYFLVKEDGVIAGLPFASAVFEMLDEAARFRALADEGSFVKKGDRVAEVEATVRGLLSGERTALNLVQRASGIATATRRFVDAVAGTRAEILDTRKTVPGLRALDKYAVAAGGGTNHRHGLHDMFLVKNNHIDRAGSITAAVTRIRETGRPQKLMVEVRDLHELDEALALSPDFILLDNMDAATMREAVRRSAGRVPLEASGGVTLASVREVAATGVDRISIGALTHTVDALDISMRIESQS